MLAAIHRSGEDVTEYFIGRFGDSRLCSTGALLFKRICETMTTCIKSLAGRRSLEVGFGRFLGNSRVNSDEIAHALSKKTNFACSGRKHVLCIQDTVQLTYPSQKEKKFKFGPTGDNDTPGLFVHPGVIVDAEKKDVLGLSSVISWCRDNDPENSKDKNRSIEEKESIRWINTAKMAQERITNSELLTVIGDRESDILELFKRIPDKKTHLLVRASHDRVLNNGDKISEHFSNIDFSGNHEIRLHKITGKRKARNAILGIKYSSITIFDKSENKDITLNCVLATEISKVPAGEKPISWVLLTTHEVNSLDDSLQILTWYTWRWIIEQIFRTMKNKGMQIEDSQIETPSKLLNMSVLCIASAIKVMNLVESRDGNTTQKTIDIFFDKEIELLDVLCKKAEGQTVKQKNPYSKNILSWAAWIIARLGGWNGYKSESPPGPTIMLRGLRKFESIYEGWILAKDVCIG